MLGAAHKGDTGTFYFFIRKVLNNEHWISCLFHILHIGYICIYIVQISSIHPKYQSSIGMPTQNLFARENSIILF